MPAFDGRSAIRALGIDQYQGAGYLDEVQLQLAGGTREQLLLVRRTYAQVADALTAARQLPAWQQFAHARQGME